MNFNYDIINKEFENDKIWVIFLKSSILTILKTTMKFNSNSNLKIFDLSNNRFEPILNFQMKSLFSNIALLYFITSPKFIRLNSSIKLIKTYTLKHLFFKLKFFI